MTTHKAIPPYPALLFIGVYRIRRSHQSSITHSSLASSSLFALEADAPSPSTASNSAAALRRRVCVSSLKGRRTIPHVYFCENPGPKALGSGVIRKRMSWLGSIYALSADGRWHNVNWLSNMNDNEERTVRKQM